MADPTSDLTVSRREVLRASGGLLGLSVADSDDSRAVSLADDCENAQVQPGMRPCESATKAGCADDHPETVALRDAVETSLTTTHPTVGALLEAGYIPYFDLAVGSGPGDWSHWLNPGYINDDAMLDPSRPASVMVDNELWRPLGVMFIAVGNGDPVEPRPVYGGDDPEQERCSPWHSHVGLPGRYAWWKHQAVFERDLESAHSFPCRTPCMMHVWIYPHPESVYAHDAPPPENRGGRPATPAGFETDAVPGEDVLGVDVVAEDLVAQVGSASQ